MTLPIIEPSGVDGALELSKKIKHVFTNQYMSKFVLKLALEYNDGNKKGLNVEDLKATVNISHSLASQYLRKLKKHGILKSASEGRYEFYSINKKEYLKIFGPVLMYLDQSQEIDV